MTRMPHKHNTRISTGVIKRKKYIMEDSSSSNSDSSDNYSLSDDSSNDFSNDDFDDSSNDEESTTQNIKKFDKVKYYEFLNSLYPSHYSKNKINEIKKHKRFKITNNDAKINKLFNNSKIKKNKIYKNVINNASNKKKLLEEGFKKLFENINSNNIILHLKTCKNTDSLDEYYEEEEDEEEEEEDESDEKRNCKEEDKRNCEEEAHEYSADDKQNCKEEDEAEYCAYEKQNCADKYSTDFMRNCSEDDIIPASKQVSNKNYKIFDKILEDEEKESEYFKKHLSKKSQLLVIDKLQKIKNLTKIDKPYLLHLVDLDIPDEYKACALRKINTMRSMGGGFGNSEYYKIKSWIDAFLKIPFNKYNNLPISYADGIEKCHDFMEHAKKTLDSVTYGLEDAKMQIMQMVGLWLVNPNAVGSAIAIKGPPGTGKTTLIKEGISKILNRPFALIALGGCGDSGFLDGFDYTYEGSKYGKIVDILIQSGCMNPIILFDELDKLSDSFKGQEITGVLTHLTDSTQNNNFTDKYLSEISLNMSKALYIFSYNDESAVNPILKDRMYKIETTGYKTKEKLIIAKDYLLPKIREEIKFEIKDVTFNDEIIEYIINDFTLKEDGVRNLKRCLEIIYKKLNLYRLMKPGINLFESNEGLKKRISFPCILTKEMVDDLINKGKNDDIPFGIYL